MFSFVLKKASGEKDLKKKIKLEDMKQFGI